MKKQAWPICVSLMAAQLASAAHAACVPARESVNYPHFGQYHRVHPTGNYMLVTHGGMASLVDISNRRQPATIRTPMLNETYPVEGASGGWDLLASPYDTGYMRYYQMKDLLAQRERATDVYRDAENNEYYHSSAELPGSTASVRKVRTLLYGKRYRDYTMRKDAAGNFTQVEPGPAGKMICQEFSDSKRGKDQALTPADAAKEAELKRQKNEIENRIKPLQARIAELNRLSIQNQSSPDYPRWVEEKRNLLDEEFRLGMQYTTFSEQLKQYRYGSRYIALRKLTEELNTKFQAATSDRERGKIATEIERASAQAEGLKDDQVEINFANPVLSKDGTLVAAAGANQIAVFRILDNGKCERLTQTKYSGGKVSFSYPEAGKLPKITFSADSGPSGSNRGGVYVMDLNTQKSTFVAKVGGQGDVGRYPGFTRDGRVIYGTSEGFEIVDPNQVGGSRASCIQQSRTQGSTYENEAEPPAQNGSSAE